jgi:hypothetical protein
MQKKDDRHHRSKSTPEKKPSRQKINSITNASASLPKIRIFSRIPNIGDILLLWENGRIVY